jgi:lipopolysaccharide biosynthesis regulator YciM
VKWIDKLGTAHLNSPPASIAVADAYAAVKNWSRVKRWARTGNWGDAEYLRLAYEAIAERHLHSGNAPGFEKLWQSAVELSGNDPERELTLARLATKWQLASQAEELWTRVEQNPTMRREALDNLRELYRTRDDTTRLYAVLERLHQSSPNEAAITADLARLGLNLGENTERSHQFAKEAYDRAPNDVNCALTYAYSLHRLGRNPEALAVIQTLPPEQLHDAHSAVYVALVLADGNEPARAKDYITAAENAKLYPEEKTLLEEVNTKLTAASAIAPPTASPPIATPSP